MKKGASEQEQEKNMEELQYPSKEDIYNKEEKEPLAGAEKGSDVPPSDADLDVPGAELDDENEAIGEEDEENNYYSLGGDNHNDLEEDRD